jgi:hypothetical protein
LWNVVAPRRSAIARSRIRGRVTDVAARLVGDGPGDVGLVRLIHCAWGDAEGSADAEGTLDPDAAALRLEDRPGTDESETDATPVVPRRAPVAPRVVRQACDPLRKRPRSTRDRGREF